MCVIHNPKRDDEHLRPFHRGLLKPRLRNIFNIARNVADSSGRYHYRVMTFLYFVRRNKYISSNFDLQSSFNTNQYHPFLTDLSTRVTKSGGPHGVHGNPSWANTLRSTISMRAVSYKKRMGVCDPLPKTLTRIFPALIRAKALFLTKPSTKPYHLGPHMYLWSHDIRKGHRPPGQLETEDFWSWI